MTYKLISLKKGYAFFTAIFLLITFNSMGQDLIGKFEYIDGEKNITNLSGKFNDSISFNLIINKVKETKEYKSSLFFYSKTKIVKEFSPIFTKGNPNFLTYHVRNNTLTIIRRVYSEIETYDFDFLNGNINVSKSLIKPKMVFSHDNVTYITNQYENKFMKLIKIKSSTETTEMIIKPKTKEERLFLFNLNKEGAEFINDNVFVEKGSIKKYRGFYSNDNLVFIRDNKSEGTVAMYMIDEKGVITTKSIKILNVENSSKQNSFIKDNLLFVFSMRKKTALLSVLDIKSSELLAKYYYDDTEEFGEYSKVVVNGNEVIKDFNPKKFFRSFFSAAIGTVYNAKLYIGVNKSKTGDYIVQIGHVDKNTFYNKSSNNTWWNYPAFSLNYTINTGSLSAGFNPSAFGMAIFNAMAEEKRKGNFFELNLNENLSVKKDDVQISEFYNFDIDEYNRRFENLMILKRYFYIPMDDYVRLINYDKKTKSYQLYNLPKL